MFLFEDNDALYGGKELFCRRSPAKAGSFGTYRSSARALSTCSPALAGQFRHPGCWTSRDEQKVFYRQCQWVSHERFFRRCLVGCSLRAMGSACKEFILHKRQDQAKRQTISMTNRSYPSIIIEFMVRCLQEDRPLNNDLSVGQSTSYATI